MNWSYLFKHWFGTLLLGPLLAHMMEFYSSADSHLVLSILEAYPIFLIFGLICSSPTYILYGGIYYLLGQKDFNLKFAKAILILFSVSGVIITFWLIGGSWSINGIQAYCLASIISGIYFTLNFKET
ncbi:MAG: hypothetical protein RL427_827 [Bacteroidota bacterium]|jgi:hypothetical protein